MRSPTPDDDEETDEEETDEEESDEGESDDAYAGWCGSYVVVWDAYEWRV